MKSCARCGEVKVLAEFQRRASARHGRGSYCWICAREMGREQKAGIAADPARKAARAEWVRTHHREAGLRRYGLTVEEYEALAVAQGHRCAICRDPGLTPRELVPVADRKNVLAVDHCHMNGRVRGLLCTRCNSLLGMARDSEKILMAAIRYLRASQGVQMRSA